jgi:hypothetical protein
VKADVCRNFSDVKTKGIEAGRREEEVSPG